MSLCLSELFLTRKEDTMWTQILATVDSTFPRLKGLVNSGKGRMQQCRKGSHGPLGPAGLSSSNAASQREVQMLFYLETVPN